MQREEIIDKLKNSGCRITKQRLLILDTILEGNFTCCKDIYYKVAEKNDSIGFATVYRMMNTLEEIGAIDRSSMYKINGNEDISKCEKCMVSLSDNTTIDLSEEKWNEIIREGMIACGLINDQDIKHVVREAGV
jgi:Fur family ferric uptake transcriptional regulator